MKILIIDEEIPFPLNSGKRLRTFNLLKCLAKKHKIVFVCRAHEQIEETCSESLAKLGIETIIVPHIIRPKSGLKFYWALFANLFSRYPYSVTSHYSDKLVLTIKSLLKTKKFDLVHCEWTPYALNMDELFGDIPTVVDAHNVEAIIWKRNFEIEKNTMIKLYIYLQWKKMHFFEKKFFKKFTRVISVSEADKNIISSWADKNKITVIPNGVDTSFFQPQTIAFEPHTIVFTGSMDWRPNIDGVHFFIDEVWPIIINKYRDAKFLIVGRNPPFPLKEKIKKIPSLTLTGTVDDVRPYINQASVYIVPLRVGGGSRLKILEALSMKKAVVSTTIGAEGLNLVPDKEILIADTPELFAEKIFCLFKDDVLKQQLGENGKKIINSQYQWEAIAEKMDKVWEKAITQNQ